MFEDVQGTFWFCTLDDGIYGLPLDAPVTYSKKDGMPSDNLVSAACDGRGRILFGDDEGNMNILHNGRLAIERYGSTDGYNRVLGIHPLSDTETWVVTDEGIYIQYANGQRTVVPKAGSPKVILPDGEHVWCGTSAGLYKFSRRTKKIEDLTYQRVTALAKDSDGILWAGGIEGLHNSADTFLANWGEHFRELQNRIIALRDGGNGMLWVATPEHGLLQVRVRNGAVLQVLRVNEQLKQPITGIHSMHLADNGRLWLATNRGVFGLNPEDWSVLRYNHFDGLANNDVKSIVAVGDTLWVTTPSGLTRMLVAPLPSKGDFATYITTVRYRIQDQTQEIYLNDAPSTTRTTTLPLNASLVEVDFAGLDYRSRGNLMFDCIITEEFPPLQWITTDYLLRWIENGFRPIADTTRLYQGSLDFGVNMPAGNYKISVVALTQNNVYGRHSGEWSVVMPARWHATIWFSLLIWSLMVLVMYRIYRIRVELREMALAVARFRLMALQAQINPHFIGNAINAIQRFFYPPDPIKASQYNSTFIRMLRKTLDFSEHTFISFEQEVAYNRDYLEMARLRYGDHRFQYAITGTERIPPTMPYPALFLQPILENATIHGVASDGISIVTMDYIIRGDRLVCTITDNGPGLNNTQAGGGTDAKRRSKGIEILRKKAATLNHLFDLDMRMSVTDLSTSGTAEQGTQAVVSFSIKKIEKTPRNSFVA